MSGYPVPVMVTVEVPDVPVAVFALKDSLELLNVADALVRVAAFTSGGDKRDKKPAKINTKGKILAVFFNI